MGETYQLTDLQIAIMRVLWERGQATVAEIHDALKAERGLALTTVATLLSRLEKRGVVSHETRQRQFLYRPSVSEAEVRHSMVHELTERLFDGDVTAMMSHLLSDREMTPGDLQQIQRLIAEHAARKEGGTNAR
ncbi:MAG TPA: BlaI/MecI/CopY family transcriptional regulator [Gemmatimonadales bacterium]|nr:BlaI/MecI/CopY family transcriptional regulator [Gemmatimonadales bacterium]